MKFSDLLSLPYDVSGGRIQINALERALPSTPRDVAEQFFVEHGRNPDFQQQYSDIQLCKLKWTLIELNAGEIIACSVYKEFQRWFNSVSERAKMFCSSGWGAIDFRPDVQSHWETTRTWARPPVMLSAAVIGMGATLHLVEGHTRVGLLSGLGNV
jgi:hypothetical protein